MAASVDLAAPHRHVERAVRDAQVGEREARTHAGIALAVWAQTRAPHAVDAVVTLHRPHVHGQVRRLRVSRADQPHYESVGAEALVRQLGPFDASRGVPLWGYARKGVRGALIGGLGASIGLTAHQTRAYSRVWRAHDAAVADDPDHRVPLAAEVYRRVRHAHGSGIGIGTVEAVLSVPGRRVLLLDELSARGRARALRVP